MRKVIVICLLFTAIFAASLPADENTSLDKAGVKGTTQVQRHRRGGSTKYIQWIKEGKGFSCYRRRRKYVVILKGKKKCRVYKFGLRSRVGKRLTKYCRGVPTGSSCYVKKVRNKWCVTYKVKGRRIRRRYPCGRKFITVLKRGLAKKKAAKVAPKVRVVRRGNCWFYYRWNGRTWVLTNKKCGKGIRGLCRRFKLKLKNYRCRKIKFGLSHGRFKCKIYPKRGRPIIRYCPCNKKTFKVYQKICTKGRRYGLARRKRAIVIGGRNYRSYTGKTYRCYQGVVWIYRNNRRYRRYTGNIYICYRGAVYSRT